MGNQAYLVSGCNELGAQAPRLMQAADGAFPKQVRFAATWSELLQTASSKLWVLCLSFTSSSSHATHCNFKMASDEQNVVVEPGGNVMLVCGGDSEQGIG